MHSLTLRLVWETYEAHKALMALPDYEESVQKFFGPLVSGPPEIVHIQNLVGDFNAAFAAPVTEIATFKLKGDATMDVLREQIRALGSELGAALAFAWGDCVEHPDRLVALLGWPSVEVISSFLLPVGINSKQLQAHKAAAKGERAGEVASKLMAQTHISIKHYSFKKMAIV